MRKLHPLRKVVSSSLFWMGNPHKAGPSWGYHFLKVKLECGHTVHIRGNLRPAKRRRCDECTYGLEVKSSRGTER